MLSIKKLNAGYDELKVLENVDLFVKPEEIVSIIGPNGSGKSTILKSVFSIANVSSGNISFLETDITGLPTHELLSLGISYVPQGRINFTNLTVRENLELGALKIKEKDLIAKKLEVVYRNFPVLKKKESELAFSLSGGEQQMLAIGRALMQSPKLLLMDEPTLGLSPLLQKELFAKLVSLRDSEEISILLVEQNAKKAIEISDRVYVLENGSVALTGSRKQVEKNKMIKSIYLGGN